MDLEKLLDKTRQDFTNSIIADLSHPDFNWNQLINLILEEDSPLQAVLSEKTARLADACESADRLNLSYREINEEEKGNVNVERDREEHP